MMPTMELQPSYLRESVERGPRDRMAGLRGGYRRDHGSEASSQCGRSGAQLSNAGDFPLSC
jgi:hypothetical protein